MGCSLKAYTSPHSQGEHLYNSLNKSLDCAYKLTSVLISSVFGPEGTLKVTKEKHKQKYSQNPLTYLGNSDIVWVKMGSCIWASTGLGLLLEAGEGKFDCLHPTPLMGRL